MSKGTTLEECDLVMKGGITSGIVYPPLISVLKDKYRFRSIGGTSAGAIAAAGTAAAEYGREANGFAKLDNLTKELSEGMFLPNLFRPSRRTRPLFNLLLSSTRITKSKGRLFIVRLLSGLTWSLLKEATVAFLAGAFVGVSLTFLFSWLVGGSVQGLGIIVAILFGWLGGLAAGVIKLGLILLKDVPRNFLGMCTGRQDDAADEDSTVLTDWLNDRFDDMAGIKNHPVRHESGYKPLTFHDLNDKKFGDARDEGTNGRRENNITLRMVTSNLSQNQPYILPFRENIFIFNKDEFSSFFPKRVIDYLIHPDTPRASDYVLPDNYYFLPEADALPVIVATRMSLSFPILLSAVPLYTIKTQKLLSVKKHESSNKVHIDDLQKNWFSDGGICSNFPIQFFDGWLPMRPTFGVNLTSLPERKMTEGKSHIDWDCLSPTSSDVTQPNIDAIYLPKPEESPVTEYITFEEASSGGVPNLFRFLWSIFSTAQNYRDNTQSVLPSYRERIVQIRLGDDEGGLNLTMAGNTIKNVVEKGEVAGKKLRDDFSFEDHQWVRFRVLMKGMEASLVSMYKVIRTHPFYQSLLNPTSHKPKLPYSPTREDWAVQVAKRLTQIGKEIESFVPEDLFAEEPSPLPEPVLRVTPEV